MIELTLICMVMCNVNRLMNDQDSTWMFQVSGLRKELLPSLPKTQSLVESLAPCLLVSWSELPPLRPEDFDLILLGPWGIDLIPCLLSLRGRLWITPRELQLHSLHWTSYLLRGVKRLHIFLNYFLFAPSRIQNWRKNGPIWRKIQKKKMNSAEFMQLVFSKSGGGDGKVGKNPEIQRYCM